MGMNWDVVNIILGWDVVSIDWHYESCVSLSIPVRVRTVEGFGWVLVLGVCPRVPCCAECWLLRVIHLFIKEEDWPCSLYPHRQLAPTPSPWMEQVLECIENTNNTPGKAGESFLIFYITSPVFALGQIHK